MPRHLTLGAIAAVLFILNGCAADAPVAPAPAAHARVPNGASRTDYPVDGSGNPDQSQAAIITSATVSLGLINQPQAGGLFDAVMTVEGWFNRAQVTGTFEIKKGAQTLFTKSYDSGEGSPVWLSATAVQFQRHEYWNWTFTCGATATGSTSNKAHWFAQIPPLPAVSWGDDAAPAVAPPASPPANNCVAPTVAISPAPSVDVEEGVLQQFTTSTLTAGSGDITAYEWRVDGNPAGSSPTFGGTFTAGTHTVTLAVTNSVGLSTTSSATTVGVFKRRDEVYCNGVLAESGSCENDGEGGSGGGGNGGGGGTTVCTSWQIKVYVSYDGGVTWFFESETDFVTCL
jgi:hypothetical protein